MRNSNSTNPPKAIRGCPTCLCKISPIQLRGQVYPAFDYYDPFDPTRVGKGYADFDTAMSALNRHSEIDGLAILLINLTAVIVNACVGPDGKPEQWIEPLISRAYCEYTPDRRGLIFIVLGDI